MCTMLALTKSSWEWSDDLSSLRKFFLCSGCVRVASSQCIDIQPSCDLLLFQRNQMDVFTIHTFSLWFEVAILKCFFLFVCFCSLLSSRSLTLVWSSEPEKALWSAIATPWLYHTRRTWTSTRISMKMKSLTNCQQRSSNSWSQPSRRWTLRSVRAGGTPGLLVGGSSCCKRFIVKWPI